MLLSADNRFVSLEVNEHPVKGRETSASDLTHYLLDLQSGERLKLPQDVDLLAMSGHFFLEHATWGISKTPIRSLDGLKEVRRFEIGEHNAGWWNSKTGTAIFESGWPQAEGFTSITILNPSTGESTKVDLQLSSQSLGICRANGRLYTEHSVQDSAEAVDEYDYSGKFVGTSPLPLGVFSASCRYVLPFIALARHGPDTWGIYDANSRVQLVEFPWKEDSKTDLHRFMSWNPHNDNLLLMNSVLGASNLETIDVYDVAQRKVIKSWPSSNDDPPVVWSGDGMSGVTVRDHHIVFDPIVPEVPK